VPRFVDHRRRSLLQNVQAVLVVSSEGLKTVDEFSREVISNVIIKAISYSTEIVGKKFELFAFIEVDDRRNTKTCHVYLCEKGAKGQALDICNAVCTAFEKAVEEAKARAGNPLLPMGKIRETVTGPLAEVEIPRKELIAVKAIGAGQFGKVFLATSSSDPTVQRAVKMLRSGASNGDRTEFLREAETMLNLGTHANIVSFQGAAVKQRPWLVVLEYCQYGDLSDVLKALGRRKIALTLREQMGIAEQLATGMAYVASKGFVHMDLAVSPPSNSRPTSYRRGASAVPPVPPLSSGGHAPCTHVRAAGVALRRANRGVGGFLGISGISGCRPGTYCSARTV